MPAGYSGTPLAHKLGIKPGHRVASISAPDHFPALLVDLPIGVRVEGDPEVIREGFDVVVMFARTLADLREGLEVGASLINLDGGLWVGWPKKSSPLASDFSEGDVRSLGLVSGLVDNKICAIDEDWSGLRFVYRLEDRKRIRAQSAE